MNRRVKPKHDFLNDRLHHEFLDDCVRRRHKKTSFGFEHCAAVERIIRGMAASELFGDS